MSANLHGQLLCQGTSLARGGSIATSIVFLILAPCRLYSLRNEETKGQGAIRLTSQISSPIPAAAAVAQLVSMLKFAHGQLDIWRIVETCLALATAVAFIVVSAVEHRKTIRPSSAIVAYLLAMLGSDVFALTHPGHAGVASTGSQNDRGLTAITLVVRLTLLAFECRDKSLALFSKYAGLSPEETVGVLSRTFFCWLAGLMALGNKRMLRPADMPPLDTQQRGAKLRGQALKHWESRERPERGVTLLSVLARCLMAPALRPIIPRLCVTVCRCSQPVLIRQAMAFVSGTNEHAECRGNWILSAAIVIYGGLAVCTSLYRHRLNRLQIGIRASLVALVYDKALKISSDVFDANRVVTIMGTDIDSVSGAGEMLHETWGQFAELATGMILLAREVKWLWPLPLAIIVASSRVSKYVAANVRMRQKNWTAATQTRISTLSSTLGSMKSVKAMGLAGHLGDYITDLRQAEIESSKDVRWMHCIYNASANAVGIFTPVVTVVLFALVAAAQGVQLDAKTTFTTTAILAVVTHPANMIMTIVPRAIAALANHAVCLCCLDLDECADVVSVCRLVGCIHVNLRRATFMLLASRSGRMLHQALLVSIFGAPLSYFVSTDTGVTLNRFSQDISLVDRQLPVALSGLCTQILKMTVQLAILLQVQRQLWLALPVCIAVVYVVQRVYLRTSRQLRALELESHSALYSWFLETVDGVVSIRSFAWQASATARNLEGLDSSARPEYALMCLQCWLNLVLDLLVGLVAVGVIAVALRWRDATVEANLGMSLNIIFVTSPTLVRLVQSWTSLDVSLGAVARLKSAIEETPSEDKPGEGLKPDAWPTRGDLHVRNLSAGLENMVLTSVDLDASPGQKLVICGRTGSGKSTIVLSLLWLIESSGSINVDGVPLSRIRRSAIRDQCFITVPQDAFFLPQATLQFNLDPSGRVPRSILRDALLSVDMWVPVSAVSPGADPFDQPMSSLPSFSVGQTQLLAMARAVVKRHALAGAGEYHDDEPCRPILLLDEATSSLDAATEAKIYDIVQSVFTEKGYTVVIVAHRVSMLADRMRPGDHVAWIQDGRVVKVGNADDLRRGLESWHEGQDTHLE
ncbi:multidrug resistance-associated protein [Purpureocillium lilacinum]|uniref:Multidrug resistance-associated protein n=1 Tax=Purpureocillium lilacinum TaxID=33203 RepID=A0A2U3EC92_PURLI|nr:multidrug resistance-associated protein [Purpureocillium lilacinum]